MQPSVFARGAPLSRPVRVPSISQRLSISEHLPPSRRWRIVPTTRQHESYSHVFVSFAECLIHRETAMSSSAGESPRSRDFAKIPRDRADVISPATLNQYLLNQYCAYYDTRTHTHIHKHYASLLIFFSARGREGNEIVGVALFAPMHHSILMARVNTRLIANSRAHILLRHVTQRNVIAIDMREGTRYREQLRDARDSPEG